MIQTDVPSPIDFHLMQDAQDWESKAMDRPFRLEMFEKFADCISTNKASRILELGSGPGFLAEYLCERNRNINLTLLDFSEAMHELARKRLANHTDRVDFITRDFKEPNWTRGLATYDCVISNQAVHELRHTRHATTLHTQVRPLLNNGGEYLVCDHFFGEGGMANEQLYMSVEAHISSLEQGQFEAELLLQQGSLVFIRAV